MGTSLHLFFVAESLKYPLAVPGAYHCKTRCVQRDDRARCHPSAEETADAEYKLNIHTCRRHSNNVISGLAALNPTPPP